MNQTENTISIENLTMEFDGFKAVDGISFQVKKGEVFGFLGPNGSGKSTTIRMLCGLLKPTAGRASVLGLDINRHPEAVKLHIGYMSQRFSLYNDLTVSQNLNFYGGVYKIGRHLLKERKEWVVETLSLKDKLKKITAELPGGIKQRLAFGCAILHKPRIIFLDEPTGGIDPLARREFWALINQFASQGTTILVTTHYMDESEYCQRIGLILAGKIVALGTLNELRKTMSGIALFQINTPDIDRCFKHLKSASRILNTAIFGNRIHFTTLAGFSEEEIRRDLAAAAINIEKLEAVSPTLEDIFIHLIKGRR